MLPSGDADVENRLGHTGWGGGGKGETNGESSMGTSIHDHT